VKKLPFGVRFLYHSNFLRKKAHKPGFFYNAEGGIRPGIYEKSFPNSLYLKIGIGFTI